ncbi:16S rRNA (guanine(966)-N(2))-methyltransferase RsmD [soil metagenome]
MTRIIAGLAGGRTLQTPRGSSTRPTTDRVREALFSRIDAVLDLQGAHVLDLYAGSGALGLEAASRGAAVVRCIEADRRTATLISGNAAQLGLDAVEVRANRVERVLAAGSDTAYDLVLADPPYPLSEPEISAMLQALVAGGWLAGEAMVVLERSHRSPMPDWPAGIDHVGSRRYGQTALHEGIAAADSRLSR